MTNEQEVVVAKRQIAKLKQDYLNVVNNYLSACNTGHGDLETLFLSVQQEANKYFNYVDEFVGDSDLLGAHKSGIWVTGFAEDCASVLSSLCKHILFIRNAFDNLNIDPNISIEPALTAYANIQRMVVKYLPDDTSSNLKQQLVQHALPTFGFDNPAVMVMEKTQTWKLVTGLVLGVIALVAITVASIMIPSPTEWQMFIFRGVFAISLSAIAAIIPGFIDVTSIIKTKQSYFRVVSGGAIAIFVLIWFINPPLLIQAG
ncbi:hypothetical protein ACED51_20875 [Photobacterium swingsii]|uniref:hypothetical protein n=1 Tax=Photobacterium swingsii TaxID=680026 RepID=UPI00352CD491